MKEILKKKELDLAMPVKMEWEHTTMVSAMGMEWTDTTDIALLDIPSSEFTTESDPYFSAYGVSLFSSPISPKNQIISHDCMWSGTCGDKSHPGKTHPLHTPCSTATSIVPQPTSNNNTPNVNNCKVTTTNKVMHPAIQQQQQQTMQVVKQQQQQMKQEMKIPAGRSLLRNFNNNNNNNQIINSSSKHVVVRGSSVNDKNSGSTTRPDTPLSLDDDSPEFKHHIDLAGTIAGTMNNQFSNGRKISICANTNDDSSHIISMLKEHLEDDDTQGQKTGHILELLSHSFGNDANGQSENVLDFLKYLSDYEEEDDSAVDMDSDSDEYTSSSSGYGCSSSIMKTDKYSSCTSSSSSTNSNNNSNAQLSHVPVPYDYQETHFGDHSYTRPKDRFDTRDLGVQTPSDSGKFIILVIHLFFFTVTVH